MKTTFKAALVCSVIASVMAAGAMAGADTTFDSVYNTVMGWLDGSLGKLLAGAFVIVGLVAGIARQSLLAFAVGMGAAVGIANISTILGGIVTATLENVPVASQAAIQLSNGLI